MRIHGGEAARPGDRRRPTLLALGGLAASVAVLHAGSALAATPLSGDIAFASKAPPPGHTGPGHYRINVMNTDGVGVALNPNPAGAYDDQDPAWSPDGKHIAFASTRSGNWDIYVMNADGTGVTRVTTEPRDDRYPAWSPDGTKLAYRGYAGATGGSQIFVSAPNGAGATPLKGTGGGDQPSWAPDSRQIAFTNTSVTPGPVISITDTVTHVTKAITGGPSASDRYPSWAPNSTLVFRRFDPTGQGREVWTIDSNGGSLANLSSVLGAPARSASWSPDSRYLVFVSYRDADHNQEIWLGSRDGSLPARQLTFTTWDNDEPKWANVPAAVSPVPPATGHPGGGGTVGGGVVPGTHQVALSLSMRVRRQALGHRKSLRVKVRCNQRCAVVISGTLKPKGSKKVIRTRRARRTLAAGRWVRVNVRLGSRALRSVRSSLRHHHKVRISLSATARNNAGAFTPAVARRLTLKR